MDMKRHLILVFTFVFSLIASNSVQADNYYVSKVKGKTITKADRDSIHELIETSLMDEGQTVVQSVKKADFWIASNVIKIGNKFAIIARKRLGKKTIESRKVKFNSMDNVDQAVEKVIAVLVPLQENVMTSVVEKTPQNPPVAEKPEMREDSETGELAEDEADNQSSAIDKSAKGGSIGIAVFKDYGSAVERGVLHFEAFNLSAINPHIGFKFAFDASFIIYNFFDDKNKEDVLKERSIDSFLTAHTGPVFYFLYKDFSPFISLLGGFGGVFGVSVSDDLNWVIGGEFGIAMNRRSTPIFLKIKYMSLVNTDLPERPKVLSLSIGFAH